MLSSLRSKIRNFLKKKNVWLASDWYQMPDFDLDKDVIMEIANLKSHGPTVEDVKVIHTFGGNYLIGVIFDKKKQYGPVATMNIAKEEYDNYNSEYVKRKKRGEIINKILK